MGSPAPSEGRRKEGSCRAPGGRQRHQDLALRRRPLSTVLKTSLAPRAASPAWVPGIPNLTPPSQARPAPPLGVGEPHTPASTQLHSHTSRVLSQHFIKDHGSRRRWRVATAIPSSEPSHGLGARPSAVSVTSSSLCVREGRSPQAAQLLRHVVCLCLSGSVDHCVCLSHLCLGLCVFLRLCGLRVALGLSISFCSCVWVPGYVAVSLCISILASPQGPLSPPTPCLHCSAHHRAPEQRGRSHIRVALTAPPPPPPAPPDLG